MMSDVFKNGITTQATYVFPQEGRSSTGKTIRRKIWQIVPSSIASLMCLPFGLMLGWPSPTYPKLLPRFSPNSPINITIDQSAMIAGFLMIGNTVATPLSTISVCGSKYGITTGLILMLSGWILMRFANSIYYLLGSRLLIGLGFGYGVGQLKIYIRDMCQSPYSLILTRLITFYTFFGVIVAFTLGSLTNFRDFSTIVIIMTAVILLLCLFLPHTPKEYLTVGKIHEAKTVLLHTQTTLNVDDEIRKLRISSLVSPPDSMGFPQVIRDKSLRKYLLVIWILTILQQFTGAPATIVYSQIIFIESNCPYSEMCAIAYSVLFFVSNFVGTFVMRSFNKKACLLFSSVFVTLTLILNVTIFYFKVNSYYWEYTSLITMCLYIFVHSTGLAVVPFLLIPEYFPPSAVTVVSKFHIMQNSTLALIITKIFQVLYDKYTLYVPFCLFLGVSVLSSVFIWFLVPYNAPVLDKGDKPLRKSTQLISKL